MSNPVPTPIYTTDHSSSVLRTHGWRTAANSAGYLIPHIKQNMTILDIGCGPGSITIDLARLVPQGHVTGIEYVLDPLEQARSLASAQKITNVSFQIGDIHSLEFPDNTFDIVHAHQVLQHVADPVRALREMRRVVKPGGMVACRESASMTWYPPSEGIDAWWALSNRISRGRGGNPHPGSHIHVWAEKAGFDKTDIAKSAGTWCFSSPEERTYWGGSMAERASSSGFVEVAVKEGFAMREDIEEMVDGWKSFVEDESGWYAVLHGEIVCTK
ncbi:putative ubiE/COQ5 methyltransferase [Amanita rubescens]|nr:putative ubiE/COQ5 methyltransferase [Amanita rubescens]